MRGLHKTWIIVLLLIVWMGMAPQYGNAAQYKVLVLMSYEENFFWNQDVRGGIESIFGERCLVKYAYLNVLSNHDGIEAKAREMYALYQEFQPDGVIAVDDDVQESVVLPYLKDKVETPVIFCGVNAEPEIYGFPASNVSGILQRPHIQESLIFVQQLVPSIKTIGSLSLDIPVGKALAQQIQKEKSLYPVQMLDVRFVDTMENALEAVQELELQCDALLMGPLGNLLDSDGKFLSNEDVYPLLTKAFHKPTVTIWQEVVQKGVLCAVNDRGQEQGEVAAEMLLKAMQGTPMSELPITKNKRGKRLLNVDTMKSLGILPKPHLLRGVELIKSAQ